LLFNDNIHKETDICFLDVVPGSDTLLVSELLQNSEISPEDTYLYITSDDASMSVAADSIRFFCPDINVFQVPAWDCLPFDRVPPRREIMATRMGSLQRISEKRTNKNRSLLVTTVSAVLQRVPPKELTMNNYFKLFVGGQIDSERLMNFFLSNGYLRTGTVREPGEFAVRGGIIDVFPPGVNNPVRLDLFGDTLENIHSFDAITQRTSGACNSLLLSPSNEILTNEETFESFRTKYRKLFGLPSNDDTLYQNVSEGIRFPGMEHWLPLFYNSLNTIFDYTQGTIFLGLGVEEAVDARLELISDYHNARLESSLNTSSDEPAYKPLPIDYLYISRKEWNNSLDGRVIKKFYSYQKSSSHNETISVDAHQTIDFSEARNRSDVNLFDALRKRITKHRSGHRCVCIATYSEGSRDRIIKLMEDHGIASRACYNWIEVLNSQLLNKIGVFVLNLENGFSIGEVDLYTEQDILGERLARKARRSRRADGFISEIQSLSVDEFIVHIDHGVGRFSGLETVDIGGAPHDCLRLIYANNDKLYLPVENLELISRFGSEESNVTLDKLGGLGWQTRKANIKGKIKEIAAELIQIAAERELKKGLVLPKPQMYEEFCASFPFNETEDQSRAIDETISSLSMGRPMDRLICGDVGFGKTEVALRAAFVTSMNDYQVAVIVPTTLLAKQHFNTFKERFSDLPIEIKQISRLISPSDNRCVRSGIASGKINIVIGTHALLTKEIKFSNLGLVIIDEEQHFGVSQKEQLKKLRSDVHVLTLTATPIPRTLQLALTGVRELSLIATPPVDRLAVRTFVLPYDSVSIREAIMREHFRGGQTFYVCPRIRDIEELVKRLKSLVPEISIAVAHGQMSSNELDEVMSAFYERKFELLICTNIIESGLDLPSANTIIVHRADRFGLSQLYQLRGRVGRSKVRAYAYLTLPTHKVLSADSQKRLAVMRTLDTLGAGFSLASHDLDIRGAGNLLGEEQSGHIREVGVELYQKMLEEAVEDTKKSENKNTVISWTPVINLGTPILIPESYVADLSLRLSLYRRIANLVEEEEIQGFAAECIDRFGNLPQEVQSLLEVVNFKKLCVEADIEKLEAGPKGVVIKFYQNTFSNPMLLIEFIKNHSECMSVKADQKLVYRSNWTDVNKRLNGVRDLVTELAKLAKQ